MATSSRVKVRMVSEAGTGYFYTTMLNKKNMTEKLRLRKYDPKTGKMEWFKEEKIK
ncbi:MAG: 50S ribosomal protein L33 [Legionellales bacterium]|nr:50S ribosomal protein L33 [Legionellales bacterium]